MVARLSNCPSSSARFSVIFMRHLQQKMVQKVLNFLIKFSLSNFSKKTKKTISPFYLLKMFELIRQNKILKEIESEKWNLRYDLSNRAVTSHATQLTRLWWHSTSSLLSKISFSGPLHISKVLFYNKTEKTTSPIIWKKNQENIF